MYISNKCMTDPRGGSFIPWAWECKRGNLRVLGNTKDEARERWATAIKEGDLP